jgi:threonine dehydrogenase-like Zn-dependent dehydrogenase
VFTEPVAAAFQIPAQLTITRTDRVVVLGDGRLGNLCAQVLATLTPYVTVVGRHAHKLALLRSLGVATALLSEVPAGRTADIVVDCTGSETGLPTALRMVRPRGTIVLKTTVAGTQTLALAPIVIDEVTVIGSRCGPFGKALTALQDGSVSVLPLISARYNLSQGLDALEHARTKPVLKVLLDATAVP